MNVHLSNLLAELLEPLADEMEDKHERGSTEAVLNIGDKYNEKEEEVEESEVDREDMEEVQGKPGTEVLVGLDAVGLYPSIQKGLAKEICRMAAEKTKVKVENVNYLEATRFLSLTMTEKEVEESVIKFEVGKC